MSNEDNPVEVASVQALGTIASRTEEALIQNSLLVIKNDKGSHRIYWCGERIAARFNDGKIFAAREGGKVLFDFASKRPSFRRKKLRAVRQYGNGELSVNYDPVTDKILSFV